MKKSLFLRTTLYFIVTIFFSVCLSQSYYVPHSFAQDSDTSIEFATASVKNLEQISFKPKNFLNFDSIEDFVSAILNVFIVIATPIIVLAIIYAGFLYVTARGNAEQTKQATTALTYAVIGGLLILGAVALSEILDNVVSSFLDN